MNSNVTRTIIGMDAQELKNLTSEVKETVANNNFISKNDKSFCVADLWNIHRSRKTQGLSKRAMVSRRTTIV
jgi:hypothetical protein